MIPSDWSYEALFEKANIYMERALLADRNSSLFPFWSSLALELIGRATLSKIHPALIADPREGQNILHAFGYAAGKELPKTIGAKTIFLRLQIIVENFTPQEEKFCQSFINMRNEELHTGTPVFEGYSTNVWLTQFFKSVKILLQHQGKELSDLLGEDEAETAEQMISEYNHDLISKVNEKIKEFRDKFNAQKEEVREALKHQPKALIPEYIVKEQLHGKYKIVPCPSCSADALIVGKFISQSAPKVVEDMVSVHNNLLPVKLHCFCCGLTVSGNGELVVADQGGQFALEETFDPVDYYGIDPLEELQNQGYSMRDVQSALGYDDYGND